mgnify:CR=1 FL=1
MHLFRYLILIQDKNDKSKLVTWQYSFINTEDIQVWLRIRLSRLVLEFERRKIGSESIFFNSRIMIRFKSDHRDPKLFLHFLLNKV